MGVFKISDVQLFIINIKRFALKFLFVKYIHRLFLKEIWYLLSADATFYLLILS